MRCEEKFNCKKLLHVSRALDRNKFTLDAEQTMIHLLV